MPITWNADMDQKLFLAIMKVHNISVDHAAVAAELNTDAQPCTTMAVQKRLQKIKSMIKSDSNGGTPTPNASAKATPRKRGKAAMDEEKTTRKKAKTGNAKDNTDFSTLMGSVGDDEEIGDHYQTVKEEPGI